MTVSARTDSVHMISPTSYFVEFAWQALVTNGSPNKGSKRSLINGLFGSRATKRPDLTRSVFRVRNGAGRVISSLTARVGRAVDLPFAVRFAEHVPPINRAAPRDTVYGELSDFDFGGEVGRPKVLAPLFHFGLLAIQQHPVSAIFLEATPSHVGFYTTMLGFEVISELKPKPESGSPTFLLRLSPDLVQTQIDRHAGSSYCVYERRVGERRERLKNAPELRPDRRSFYGHFLPLKAAASGLENMKKIQVGTSGSGIIYSGSIDGDSTAIALAAGECRMNLQPQSAQRSSVGEVHPRSLMTAAG